MKKNNAWAKVILISLVGGMLLSFGAIAFAAELSFLTWKPEYVAALKQVIPQFEKETGHKVNWELVSEDVAREKITLDLASHTGRYDVVLQGNWILAESVEAGFLEPLDEYMKEIPIDLSAWYPAFIEALRYKGKLWGLPAESFGAVLTYRRDLLDRFGISPPTVMHELWDAAEKLTVDFDGNGVMDVYGCTSRAKAGEEPTIISTGFAWAFGGTWFEGGAATTSEIRALKAKPTVNTPEFMAGYKMWTDLLKNFGPPGSANFSWYEMVDTFRAGKAAFFIMYGAGPGQLDHPDFGLRDKIGATLGVWGPRHRVQENFCMFYGINKDSKNKKAAYQLLKYITGRVVMQSLADNYVTAIGRRDVNESEGFRKKHPYKTPDGKYVMEESPKTITWRYQPYIPEYAALCDILGTAASKIVAGAATTKEALEAANREMYRVMERAGYYK